MVSLKATLTGVSLLVLGILLLTVLGQYVTLEAVETQRRDVEPHAEFLVGDVVDRSYSLPASVPVFGSIEATEAPSNQSGDIRLLVLDAANYQRWTTGGQSDFLFSSERQGQFNFTFKTDKSGVYHFVLDNRASLFKKYVTLTVAYNEMYTSHVPDMRARYVGWALLVVGGVVLAYGIAKRAPIPWS